MKKVSQIEFKGETLVIRYTDDIDEGVIDERALIINWKKHPPIMNLMRAFMEITSKYFLDDNKSLLSASQEELESLFRKLLEEPPKSS